MARLLGLILAIAVGLAAVPARALEIPPIAYQQRTLANGLKVYTVLDRSTPNVSVQVWYGVGSKNDPAGRSGFAHLFEHLMFKATRDMADEEMDRLTEDVGGTNNAFTADDMTAFFEAVPANQLERLIWAEAERMGSLRVDAANFASEREVVKEELRQRVLADPYGAFFEIAVPRESFAVHPYRRPPIGSIADLDAATLADVQVFHTAWYRPDDAALIVVGNFDPASLDGWIDRYFGALQRPAAPLGQPVAAEPPRSGPRTVVVHGPNAPLPAVAITWLAPPAADPDAPALQVAEAILATGKASRLYRSLVHDRQLAQEIGANADLRAQLGLFSVTAIMADGKTAQAGEAALLAEVASLRAAPVAPEELERAKTQILSQALRRRETDEGRGFELGEALRIEGDAGRANTDLAALQAVTAADVQRVAVRYLTDQGRLVLEDLPGAESASAAEPPAITAEAPAGRSTAAPAAARQPPPAAGPSLPAVLPQVAEKRLANGLRVVVAHSTDLPILTAALVFPAGAERDDPGLAGQASLTARLAPEGAGTLTGPEIARRAEDLGATLEGQGDWDQSGLVLTILADRAGQGLALMRLAAEQPRFEAGEVARIRGEELDALKVAWRDPERLAALAAAPLPFAGTPFGHVPGGTPGSLRRIGPDDLVRFHRTWWTPAGAILVLTGDVSPQAGFALAEQAFGSWIASRGPPVADPPVGAPAPGRFLAIDLPGAEQAGIVMVQRAVARDDPRYYAGRVANEVLGGGYSSRLNQEIRIRRGLSYGAQSSLVARRSNGVLQADSQSRNETAGAVVSLMEAQLASLAAQPSSADELEARKSALIGAYGRALATTDGLADILSDLAVDGVPLDEISVHAARIEAVRADEVQAFARDVLQPGRSHVVVVGDAAKFPRSLKRRLGLTLLPASRLDLDRLP